jgi:hypothetical protein
MNGVCTKAWEFARRYLLALCCIAAPILLGFFAFNYAVDWIVPQKTSSLDFTYDSAKPKAPADSAKPKAPVSPAATQQDGSSGSDNGTSANNAAPAVIPDPKMYLVAVSIAGRYGYAIATGFIYLVSAGAIVFGIGTALTTRSWALLWLIPLGVLAWSIGPSHQMPTPYDLARPLLIDKLLDQADSFEALQPLATKNTGEAVAALVGANTVVALSAVAAILIALFALSVRPQIDKLSKASLQNRQTAIGWALLLGSALLVAAVLGSKALLQWPLSLISDGQAAALTPIADALTLELGATGTFALFGAYAPAIAAWMLDVASYREREAEKLSAAGQTPVVAAGGGASPSSDQEANDDDGLEFAPVSVVSSILGVLAPILASPFVDALKSLLGAIPH